MLPLVSILYPCYNAEKYLSYSLESILNQDYTNMQVICINDGSTDKTLELLKEYKDADTRIEILDLKYNRGLIESLNRGIELVKGQYFARMDADDFCVPDRITRQIRFITKNPQFDLVSCGYHYFVRNEKPLEYVPPVGTLPESLKFISLVSTPLTHAAVLGKSSLLHGQYWYDKNFPHSEDYELFSRLALEKVTMANLNEALYWVRINPESVSVLHNKQQINSHLEITARNIARQYPDFPKIDRELLKIISNRIDQGVRYQDLRSGLQILATFSEIAEKDASLKPEHKKEIRAYLKLHKVNILIQSNKINFSRTGPNKYSFLLRSLFLIKFSFLKYIFQKIIIYLKYRAF